MKYERLICKTQVNLYDLFKIYKTANKFSWFVRYMQNRKEINFDDLKMICETNNLFYFNFLNRLVLLLLLFTEKFPVHHLCIHHRNMHSAYRQTFIINASYTFDFLLLDCERESGQRVLFRWSYYIFSTCWPLFLLGSGF